MQKMGLCLVTLFFSVVMLGGQTFEKTVLGTAGQTSANAKVKLDWTMGETAVQAVSHSSGQLLEGFHSPGLVVEDISPHHPPLSEVLQLTFAPNPVREKFNVKFHSSDQAQVRLRILDLYGRSIQSPIQLQLNQTTAVDVTGLKSGIYLLQITSLEGKLLRTAKLSKF